MPKNHVPITSKMAWQSSKHFLNQHHGKILSAMRLLGKPSSSYEIAERAGLENAQVHKRLSELVADTMIYINGYGKTPKGRTCALYSLVEQAKKNQGYSQTELFN